MVWGYVAGADPEQRCCVPGCKEPAVILVVAGRSRDVVMCVDHATAWLESSHGAQALRAGPAYEAQLVAWMHGQAAQRYRKAG